MIGTETRGPSRGLRALILGLLILSANAAAPAAAGDEDCLACHSDSSLAMERRGRTISLHVDAGSLAGSAHKELACTDCHSGFDASSLPHKTRIAPINCMDCHGDAPSSHPFHSKIAGATGVDGEPGVSCKKCHGTHAVKPVAAEDSPFAGARQVPFCGRCHGSIVGDFSRSAHGKALASGASGAPDCISCHTQPITRARAEGTSAALKLTQEKICLSCHLDNPDVKARMGPSASFIAAYEKSVHGAALARGNGEAATCIDCHGSHEMKRGMDPDTRVYKTHIPGTCATCHAEIAREYGESVHAAALAKGRAEAPVCTDCHGEHNIMLVADPNSPVAAANVSAQVCSPCHSSVKLSEKYGIASDRFRTFADSYHGLALEGGSLEAANCASCHGSHGIKSSSDPTSTVNKANLATTCGQCHPGANARFAIGSVHVETTQSAEPVLYWISTTYIAIIILVVGGMFLHNLIDFLRKSARHQKARRGEIEEEPVGHALYLRMTLNERIQHGLLMISFTVLAITGFMLRYPEAWWVVAIRSLSDNVFELRSLLHRIAGVVMTVASVYHIGYVSLTARGRQLVRDLFPSPADARQALQYVGYNLGVTDRKPAFGRFSYIEKSEYWALVWGTIIMAATGIIMWLDNTFIRLLAKQGWDIARTIHFWEAWLATLAIVVWHIYYVVFNPDSYPMNMAWLSGRITEREMVHEHPAELEALQRLKESQDEDEPTA